MRGFRFTSLLLVTLAFSTVLAAQGCWGTEDGACDCAGGYASLGDDLSDDYDWSRPFLPWHLDYVCMKPSEQPNPVSGLYEGSGSCSVDGSGNCYLLTGTWYTLCETCGYSVADPICWPKNVDNWYYCVTTYSPNGGPNDQSGCTNDALCEWKTGGDVCFGPGNCPDNDGEFWCNFYGCIWDTIYWQTTCSNPHTVYNGSLAISCDWNDADEYQSICEDEGYVWFSGGTPSWWGVPQNIESSFGGTAFRIVTADLDNDGDDDVIAASYDGDQVACWENTGGSFAGKTLIDSLDGAYTISVADLNGDGDLDVVASAIGEPDVVYWYENDGTPFSGSWSQNSVGSFGVPEYIYAADIDGDNDVDVLVTTYTNDDIIFMRNDNGLGTSWSAINVDTNFDYAKGVFAADLDNDDDMDVIGASTGTQDEVAWWENVNGLGTSWSKHSLKTSFDSVNVFAADLNGDDDLDVIATSPGLDQVVWFENLGGGSFGGSQLITSSYSAAEGLFAIDMEGDGDVDVLATSPNYNDVHWFENVNGLGTSWTKRSVYTSFTEARDVSAADFDGDGDKDVVALGSSVAWWVSNSLSGANGRCCGDDGTSDYFSSSSQTCYYGFTDRDDDQTSCELSGFTWFTGSITGSNGPCCGDDGSSDQFYNDDLYCNQGSPTRNGDVSQDICLWSNANNHWFTGSTTGPNGPCCGDDIYHAKSNLSAGRVHSCAVEGDGSVSCWGDNSWGQSSPPALTNAIAVSSEEYFSCALLNDGSVSCWGSNTHGESSPPTLSNAIDVSSGGTHACALLSNGSVSCWGGDTYGESSPPALTNAVDVSCGQEHCCAVLDDGSVDGWGRNNYGQRIAPALSNAIGVSSGVAHSCAVKSDGSVSCWGCSGYDYGQCSPPALTNAVSVAVGDWYSCAVKSDGSVSCWGTDAWGQASPPSLSDAISIASNDFHSCALKGNGSVVCWGCGGGYDEGQCSPPSIEVYDYYEDFYNGSLSDTRHFCVDGTLIESSIDENETVCGFYDFDWFINAHYPGTYSFTLDTVGQDPSSGTIYESGSADIQVAEIHEGHGMVMQVDDPGASDYCAWSDTSFGSKGSGVIELWVYPDSSYAHGMTMTMFYGGQPAFALFASCNGEWTYSEDGYDTWHGIDYTSNDEWTHVKLDFDGSSDQVTVYFNGVDYGTYAMDEITLINEFKVDGHGSYSAGGYFDAISYDWDTNYNEGDNLLASCCGDDGSSDYFYNNSRICYYGQPISNPDYDQEFCEFKTYSWINNSHYPATYSFTDDAVGTNLPSGWSGGDAGAGNSYVGVAEYFKSHGKVLDVFDDSIGASNAWWSQSWGTTRTQGVVDFWLNIPASGNDFAIGLYDGSSPGPLIGVWTTGLQLMAWKSVDWELVQLLNPGQWYHIKIDFDCTGNGGDGSYDVYVDGVKKVEGLTFNNAKSQLSYLGGYSSASAPETGYHVYFDAFDYSWDSSGDNLIPGCCGDDFLLDNFYNDSTLCYLGYLTTDADLSKDFCELDSYWLSQHSPSFTRTYHSSPGSEYYDLEMGDLNGDGYPDFVGIEFDNQVITYINDGAGVFTPNTYSGNAVGYDLTLGDIDGDGDVDVITAHGGAGAYKYVNTNGQGTLSRVSLGDLDSETFSVDLGDVDNDGDLDLVSGHSEYIYVWINDGLGGFSYSGINIGCCGISNIELVDVDNDDDLDILFSIGGIVRVYLNDGDGTFSSYSNIFTSSYTVSSLEVGDLNGDGYQDFITTQDYQISNPLNEWINDGDGSFTMTTLDSPPWYHHDSELVDIDLDGDLDVVSGGYYSGDHELYYLYNDGAGSFSDRVTLASNDYRIRGISYGDFELDGDPDLMIAEGQYLYMWEHHGLNGTNSPCCGDDLASDDFHNGSITNTSFFCLDGSLIENPADNSQTVCEFYDFDWFTGDITGSEHPACCGDDGSNDQFYNSSFYCYYGAATTDGDSEQTICEDWGYNWFIGDISYIKSSLQDGLVSEWHFDGTGSVIHDFVGGNDGTVSQTNRQRGGKSINYLTFIRSDASAVVPQADNLDINDNLTVSAWVKKTYSDDDMDLVYGYYGYRLYVEDHKGKFSLRGPGGETSDAVSDIVLPDFEWNHLVGVYNGTHTILYQNGTQVAVDEYDSDIRPLEGDIYFDGSKGGGIDEIRIYNRSLNPEEVLTLYELDKYNYSSYAAPCCGDDGLSDYYKNRTDYCFGGYVDQDLNIESCILEGNSWFNGSLSGSNGPCCGDDGSSDDFYDEGHYCYEGSTEADDQDVVCIQMGYEWFYDSTTGTNGPCCGDDFFMDNFYSDNLLCSYGNVSTNHDLNKDYCETSYDWIYPLTVTFNRTSYNDTNGYGVDAIDFDFDGDIDIIKSGSDGEIFWHENDGLMNFTYHFIYDGPSILGDYFDVRGADFDGDGDTDVVSYIYQTDGYLYWHENDGGSFTSHLIKDYGYGGGLDIADVDNDGDIDIAFAGGSRVHLFRNDGAADPTFIETNLPSMYRSKDVHFADIDSDGDLDIIAASDNFDVSFYYYEDLCFYENADGAGYEWIEHYIDNQLDNAQGVEVADFDGDGDLDVVSISADRDDLRWYENLDGEGISWAKTKINDSLYYPMRLEVGDLDSDDDVDIIVSSLFAGTSWYENVGDASSWTFRQISNNAYYGMEASDLDLDGDLDFVASKFWYENQGVNGSFGLCCGDDTASDDFYNDTVYCYQGSTDPDDYQSLCEFYDHDWVQGFTFGVNAPCCGDDGVSDDFYNRSVYCEDGLLVNPDDDQALCELMNNTWLTGAVSGTNGPCCGDDNLTDNFYNGSLGGSDTFCYQGVFRIDLADDNPILCSHYGYEWVDWAGTESYTNRLIYSSTDEYVRTMDLVDFDLDGDYDFTAIDDSGSNIFDLILLINDGSGNVTKTIIVNDRTLTDLETVDFDLDGDYDLVVSRDENSGSDGIFWFENEEFSFTERSVFVSGGYDYGTIKVIDLDSDGDLDVILADVYGDLYWFENNGLMSFQIHQLSDYDFYNLIPIDLDEDTDIDLVVSYYNVSVSDYTLAWFDNDGSESFDNKFINNYDSVSVHEINDLDEDGDLDLIGSHYDGSLRYFTWWENDGNENFVSNEILPPEEFLFIYSIDVTDFDLDNDKDLIASIGGSIRLFENDGGEVFEELSLYNASLYADELWTVDFDGDGALNVVVEGGCCTDPLNSIYYIDLIKSNKPSGNSSCCGDDLVYDDFYNDTLNTTDFFCQDGLMTYQTIDLNESACTTYGYEWFYDAVGTGSSCCGDDYSEDWVNSSLNCCCNSQQISTGDLCDAQGDYVFDSVCDNGFFCNSNTSPVISLSDTTPDADETVYINVTSECLPYVTLIEPNLTTHKLENTTCGDDCYAYDFTPSSIGYYHVEAFNGLYGYGMFNVRNNSLVWNLWTSPQDEIFKFRTDINVNNTLNHSRINQLLWFDFNFTDPVYCEDVNGDGDYNDVDDYLSLRLTKKMSSSQFYEMPMTATNVNCTDNKVKTARIEFIANLLANDESTTYSLFYASENYTGKSFALPVTYGSGNPRFINTTQLRVEYNLISNVTQTLTSYLGTGTDLRADGDIIINAIDVEGKNLKDYSSNTYSVQQGPAFYWYKIGGLLEGYHGSYEHIVNFTQKYIPNSYYLLFNTYLELETEWYNVDYLRDFELNINQSKFNKLAVPSGLLDLNNNQTLLYNNSWITLFNDETNEGLALIRLNSSASFLENSSLNYTITGSDASISLYPYSSTFFYHKLNEDDIWTSEYALMVYNLSHFNFNRVPKVWEWYNTPITYTLSPTEVVFDIVGADFDEHVDQTDEVIGVNVTVYSNIYNLTALHSELYDDTGNLTFSEDFNCSSLVGSLWQCNFELDPLDYACGQYNLSMTARGLDTNTSPVNFTFAINDITGVYAYEDDTIITSQQQIKTAYEYCDGSDPTNINLQVLMNGDTLYNDSLPSDGAYDITYTNPSSPRTNNFDLLASDNYYWDERSLNLDVVKTDYAFNTNRQVYSRGAAGYRSNFLRIHNPSSSTINYRAEILPQEINARFSDNKDNHVNLTLQPYSTAVLFLDLFPVSIGEYEVTVNAISQIQADNATLTFEAVVQTTYSSGIFDYVLTPGLDWISIIILILIASLYVFKQSF